MCEIQSAIISTFNDVCITGSRALIIFGQVTKDREFVYVRISHIYNASYREVIFLGHAAAMNAKAKC